MLNLILRTLFSMLKSRESLILENAALRHQIEDSRRNSSRPHLKWRDRAFWDVLNCIWPDWRNALDIVHPDTVVRWHRQGFRFYWRWKSRHRRHGRPDPARVPRSCDLLRRAAPQAGAQRIRGLLPSEPDSPRAGEGLSGDEGGRDAALRAGPLRAYPRRSTSPVLEEGSQAIQHWVVAGELDGLV